ncbi:hypothetical protein EL17_12060 [Anditalea andensis]|uniref:Uncharacterized protein n=1 Tax=Anditalea andensis TaxID=1048983 RepID=A0A074LIN5_9BACT|nr:hypothetical protein EL17_12060 [Anditalea andensis]
MLDFIWLYFDFNGHNLFCTKSEWNLAWAAVMDISCVYNFLLKGKVEFTMTLATLFPLLVHCLISFENII